VGIQIFKLLCIQYSDKNMVTNGSKIAVMDIVGLLCVSLGSSPVQVADVHVQRLVSVVKMVIMLEQCPTKEQHSVVRFCGQKDSMQMILTITMFPVYVRKCLSCKAVHKWVKKISQGCLKVIDDARPGHPIEISTKTNVQQVEELI
jgi:hypothetical protein